MRGHFITTKKLMMMKKMKYALIVRSFLEQRLTSPAIDIVSTIKKMNTSVITVNGYFRLRVILKKHLKKINNGSQEEPNVPDNSNSGGTINIVYKCTECNEEYVNKWHLTRHKNSMNSMIVISCTRFTKISSFRFFYILREYENKLYTTKL